MKAELEKYFDRLWPLNRSLTGEGNRETLKILSEISEIEISEIPSGTECFDWKVPEEWNVREAWIKDFSGKKIIEFGDNNLHLLGYSESYSGSLSLSELKEHIFTLPDQPDEIPYLTSYYKKRWGFCMSYKQFCELKDEAYEVFIDAEFNSKGNMTIGENVINGNTEDEILLSTYICHPSMANNELSGPLITAFINRELKNKSQRRYTYRSLYLPETIGSIYYLSVYGEHLRKNLKAGYVITCIGDCGNFTYKKSRQGDSLSDRAAQLVLKENGKDFNTEDFFPTGSDERQYCSPGFDLPVGSLMRTRYGKYKEYHTSADNKDFISFEAMEESVRMYMKVLNVIENNYSYINIMPECEPQLGKRDLYPTIGSSKDTEESVTSLMWVLNLSDGKNDLISIAERSKLPFDLINQSALKLEEKGLLKRQNIERSLI